MPLRPACYRAIPVDHIECDENLRIDESSVDDAWLLDSIGAFGMHESIAVHPIASGGYRIIDGHRRFLCARRVGYRVVACAVYVGLDEADRALLRSRHPQPADDRR